MTVLLTGLSRVHCHTFTIDSSSSDVLRYGRVLAFNGFQWSDSAITTALSTTAVVGRPGPVSTLSAAPKTRLE